MIRNTLALSLVVAAERILPMTQLQTTAQRAAAVDIIGDLYAIADKIDEAATPAAPLAASSDTLAKLGAAVALAMIETEQAYYRTDSQSERQRLAELISVLREAKAAYRADPATPKPLQAVKAA